MRQGHRHHPRSGVQKCTQSLNLHFDVRFDRIASRAKSFRLNRGATTLFRLCP